MSCLDFFNSIFTYPCNITNFHSFVNTIEPSPCLDNTNPDGEKYPCYKVVNSKGHLSHKYAFGNIEKQKEKLESDGIEVDHYNVDLKKYQWNI